MYQLFLKKRFKKSIWFMLEIFFSLTLITYFLFLLISNINNFNLDINQKEKLVKEDLYDIYHILEKKGLIDVYLKEFNFRKLNLLITSLWPYPYSIYSYCNVFIPFSVFDVKYISDSENRRKVVFHYFFPLNVNNQSIVVFDRELNNLPTKVDFNYFYFSYPYLISSLPKDKDCVYIRLNITNLPATNFKKLRLFLDNYEIQNFEWSIENNDIVDIKINERLESLGKNWKIAFFFTNKTEELGVEYSNSLDTSNCSSFTIANLPISAKLKLSTLGTISFNYYPVYDISEGNFYFYLSFLVNNNKKKFYYDRNVEESSVSYNDSYVSIKYSEKIIYGNKMEEISKDKNLIAQIPIFYSDGFNFYEVINEVYE